jgi:hypothetical protein
LGAGVALASSLAGVALELPTTQDPEEQLDCLPERILLPKLVEAPQPVVQFPPRSLPPPLNKPPLHPASAVFATKATAKAKTAKYFFITTPLIKNG